MLEALVGACRPRAMKIRGFFKTRGGITTVVEAESVRKKRGKTARSGT
jgi:NADPH-dependent 7-cyano-7-deazaguanine reductase QueF